MKKIFLYLIIICSIEGFSQKTLLQSGPMVGYCEMTEAVIWAQTTQEADVRVDYYLNEKPEVVFSSKTYKSLENNYFTNHIVLTQLQEGKEYHYDLYINNKKIELPYDTSFSSKKLWQWREKAPDFTIALGSCSYISEAALDRPGKPYGSNYSIFESIAKKNPDIMLWGGDNVYLREADWDSKSGIYHRYTHSRSLKEIQPLLASTQNIAIWDDHDYGPDDSDRSFYNKYVTQQAFKDFLMTQEQVKRVYTEEEILASSGADFYLNFIAKGYDPSQNGDLVVLDKPGYIEYGPTGTSHGTMYTYDTHVPLLFYGWNIPKGQTSDRKVITQIAPTLAQLLKITFPNGTEAHVLNEVLQSK